jgi:hypothetical protein
MGDCAFHSRRIENVNLGVLWACFNLYCDRTRVLKRVETCVPRTYLFLRHEYYFDLLISSPKHLNLSSVKVVSICYCIILSSAVPFLGTSASVRLFIKLFI